MQESFINPLSASVALIQKPVNTANQLTDFYMRATLALNGLSFTVYRPDLLRKTLSFEVKFKDTTTF